MGCARTNILILATALALLSVVALAQDDRSAGEAQLAFNNYCRTCHVTREGDNRFGPPGRGGARPLPAGR